jgi:hypothetical protein
MVTLPGLPMLGHGQIEGFTEKYGMEYRKAYWEEKPDGYLVERHEREIFPLLRRRRLFAEVENFLLFDLYTPEGAVNEDVFAYSNRRGDEGSLVIYHNRYASARGWLKTSAAYVIKDESGSKNLVQRTLAEGLGLEHRPEMFTIYRDYITGLEYIRNNRDLHEQGFYIELDAYTTRVFLDFRQVTDNEWHQYAQLASYLGGGGVPSIEDALKEFLLQPVLTPFRELVNPGMLQWLINNRVTSLEVSNPNFDTAVAEAKGKTEQLLVEINRLIGATGNSALLADQICEELSVLLSLAVLQDQYPELKKKKYSSSLAFLKSKFTSSPGERSLTNANLVTWNTMLIWLFLHLLGKISSDNDYAVTSRAWIDEFLFGKLVTAVLKELNLDEYTIQRQVNLVKIVTSLQGWHQADDRTTETNPRDSQLNTRSLYELVQVWLKDLDFQRYINVNRYQDKLWFNKEAFEDLLWWLYAGACVDLAALGTKKFPSGLLQAYQTIQSILLAGVGSGYQVDMLLEALMTDEDAKSPTSEVI